MTGIVQAFLGAVLLIGTGTVILYGFCGFCLWAGRKLAPPKHPDQASPPSPGNHPAPGDLAAPCEAPAPAELGAHGGHVASIDIWADGRSVTLYTRSGEIEERPGECPECTTAAGHCHLCGLYPRLDPVTGRVVHRYIRCPAHAAPEHQP